MNINKIKNYFLQIKKILGYPESKNLILQNLLQSEYEYQKHKEWRNFTEPLIIDDSGLISIYNPRQKTKISSIKNINTAKKGIFMKSIYEIFPQNITLQVCKQIGDGKVEVLYEAPRDEAILYKKRLIKRLLNQNIADNITIWTRVKPLNKRDK